MQKDLFQELLQAAIAWLEVGICFFQFQTHSQVVQAVIPYLERQNQ